MGHKASFWLVLKWAFRNSNLHAPNWITANYIKQKFVDLHGEIEKHTIIVWDFNILNKCQNLNDTIIKLLNKDIHSSWEDKSVHKTIQLQVLRQKLNKFQQFQRIQKMQST